MNLTRLLPTLPYPTQVRAPSPLQPAPASQQDEANTRQTGQVRAPTRLQQDSSRRQGSAYKLR